MFCLPFAAEGVCIAGVPFAEEGFGWCFGFLMSEFSWFVAFDLQLGGRVGVAFSQRHVNSFLTKLTSHRSCR